MRFLLTALVFLLAFSSVQARDFVDGGKSGELYLMETSFIADTPYVNLGKIAGKKAFRRSMIFPGLGQAYTYGLVVDDIKSGRLQGKGFGKKLAIVGKIAGFYTAGVMLVYSYKDNNAKYKMFLKELQYRRLHNDEPDPNGSLAGYRYTDDLYTGKAIYKNNREIVLLSIGLTYGLNLVDAYVSARLNYLNVDDRLSVKFSPTLISSPSAYGSYAYTPAVKLTFNFK